MKESTIEIQIWRFFLARGCKVVYKNNPQWFYNTTKGFFQRSNSPLFRRWISDITLLYKGIYIAIEVKTPKEMNFFDRDIDTLIMDLCSAQRRRVSASTLRRYRHAIEQAKFIKDINDSWGIGFFACSLEQVKQRVDSMLKSRQLLNVGDYLC